MRLNISPEKEETKEFETMKESLRNTFYIRNNKHTHENPPEPQDQKHLVQISQVKQWKNTR